MGTAGSKGGGSPNSSAGKSEETINNPKSVRTPASPAEFSKKGISALVRPLRPGLQIRPGQSISEFNVMSLASNLSQRFTGLSGLSFISLVSAPAVADTSRRKVVRTRYRGGSLNCPGKTVWPVAQTELLFLPEFPVGTDQKLQLIFYGEVSRGAFGQVFHVQCSNTLKHYAMKVLAKSQVCSLDVVKQVKQEVMIQQMCSHHPFITPLTHHWQTRKLLIVMTEYVAYGELHQLWQSLGTFPKNLVALYVAEIAVVLDFLHNAGVIYRDLKMENLLLDEEGHIKLIDFGLAKWLRYGGRTGSICGTLHLMAPEVCKGIFYEHSADWWSLGIIAYCLIVGRYPVPLQLNHTAMVQAIDKCDYSLPLGTSNDLCSLVSGLLHRDPSQRTHSLLQLQKEALFANADLSTIVEKRVAPRKLLEEFIECKTRQNFEDFAGLTSTPKHFTRSSGLYSISSGDEIISSPAMKRGTGMSSPSLQHHITQQSVRHSALTLGATNVKPATSLGFHKRSASSPLLHPGRLGHHESASKCSGISVTNGAAVPILQSPLLRLARQHCMNQVTVKGRGRVPLRQHAHSVVNISALPSTPSLLHSQKIKERKQRYKVNKKQPSLPTLMQENSTFDSMRMSSSTNEIPSFLEESSSSTSCDKLFSCHSFHTNDSSENEFQQNESSRPLSADHSSTKISVSRSSCIGSFLGFSSSSPVSNSPVHSRGTAGSVPFISTLPPIASSPLPPPTPSSPSPHSSGSPVTLHFGSQSSYGKNLLLPSAYKSNQSSNQLNKCQQKNEQDLERPAVGSQSEDYVGTGIPCKDTSNTFSDSTSSAEFSLDVCVGETLLSSGKSAHSCALNNPVCEDSLLTYSTEGSNASSCTSQTHSARCQFPSVTSGSLVLPLHSSSAHISTIPSLTIGTIPTDLMCHPSISLSTATPEDCSHRDSFVFVHSNDGSSVIPNPKSYDDFSSSEFNCLTLCSKLDVVEAPHKSFESKVNTFSTSSEPSSLSYTAAELSEFSVLEDLEEYSEVLFPQKSSVDPNPSCHVGNKASNHDKKEVTKNLNAIQTDLILKASESSDQTSLPLIASSTSSNDGSNSTNSNTSSCCSNSSTNFNTNLCHSSRNQTVVGNLSSSNNVQTTDAGRDEMSTRPFRCDMRSDQRSNSTGSISKSNFHGFKSGNENLRNASQANINSSSVDVEIASTKCPSYSAARTWSFLESRDRITAFQHDLMKSDYIRRSSSAADQVQTSSTAQENEVITSFENKRPTVCSKIKTSPLAKRQPIERFEAQGMSFPVNINPASSPFSNICTNPLIRTSPSFQYRKKSINSYTEINAIPRDSAHPQSSTATVNSQPDDRLSTIMHAPHILTTDVRCNNPKSETATTCSSFSSQSCQSPSLSSLANVWSKNDESDVEKTSENQSDYIPTELAVSTENTFRAEKDIIRNSQNRSVRSCIVDKSLLSTTETGLSMKSVQLFNVNYNNNNPGIHQ